MKDTYRLKKDFNWFGKTIPKGTKYVQYESTKDMFRCYTPDGLECPHLDLTFHTVVNNIKYFKKMEHAVEIDDIINTVDGIKIETDGYAIHWKTKDLLKLQLEATLNAFKKYEERALEKTGQN